MGLFTFRNQVKSVLNSVFKWLPVLQIASHCEGIYQDLQDTQQAKVNSYILYATQIYKVR